MKTRLKIGGENWRRLILTKNKSEDWPRIKER